MMILHTLVAGLLVGTAGPSVDGLDDRQEREVFPIEFKWVEQPLPKRQLFPIEFNWVQVPVPMKPWRIEFRFYQYHRGSPPKKILGLPEVREIITLEQVQVVPLQPQKP